MKVISKPIKTIPVTMCGASKSSHHAMRAFDLREAKVTVEKDDVKADSESKGVA